MADPRPDLVPDPPDPEASRGRARAGAVRDTVAAEPLPIGVRFVTLETRLDPKRGRQVEIFQRAWATGLHPLAWRTTTTPAGVARGLDVHVHGAAWLVVLDGDAELGLVDLRRQSRTEGLAVVRTLSGAIPRAVAVPRGVGYALLTGEGALFLEAFTAPDDALHCRLDDPALPIPWSTPLPPAGEPPAADDLAALRRALEPFQPLV